MAFLSFLEAVRRGSGPVAADYAGWLVPHDQRELFILDAAGAERVRLAGWVRDDLTDRLSEIIHRSTQAKHRDKLAELARYYLRPIGTKDRTASRASLSNWRHDGAENVAEEFIARHATGLALRVSGLPHKGERLSLESLSRDPAVSWIRRLAPQERDMAIYRGLADAAAEAKSKADAKLLIGVALIAARLAPETNPEPASDYDGTTLAGMDGRRFTRSRLALPLVLFCLQRAAVAARQPGRLADQRTALIAGQRLVDAAEGPLIRPGPLSRLDTENIFEHELFADGIDYAWQMISTSDAKPILASLTRYGALASGMLNDREHRELALLSMGVARRHSDRRALHIELHHPSFRTDSADSVLFQLRFRRERLLLASHHRPGLDWRNELTRMNDLLVVRRRLLPGAEARRLEKVQLHVRQGILLRQARELTAAGRPMDTVPVTLTDDHIRRAVHAIDDMIALMQTSFRIADEDGDEVSAVNAHRRKTEADGVIHLLSRVPHPEALASARRLRRDLNRLDEVHADQLTDLRAGATTLWLLAMADQAVRYNEIPQARHYLGAAVAELPAGIPHLAIRSASVAVGIGDVELAKRLVEHVPLSHAWPSYLRHLVERLGAIER
ncbi:hypothetical protein [Kribbella catacumbae]|uniref:hypothetical protein n=1 Tax=Kribbella catacumbae TaxID=460086 RepID=UPI00035DF149|nr:hypothetical protein [Kribbella catacumbae]